jgi:hypothetical protein
MKKILLFILLGFSVSAQNIFPSNGNVGVGTTSPGYLFNVNAQPGGYSIFGAFRMTGGVKNPGVFFGTDETTGISAIHFSGSSGYNGRLRIGNTDAISLNNDGSIGFGPGNPYSVGKMQILTNGGTPIANRLTYGTDNTGWKFAISKNFQGTISDQIVIQDNGYVGIGTSNPTERLELGGGRPITFNSNLGNIKMKGDPGGWAMSYGFVGSNGTDFGGLWGFGGADALYQWSIGKQYTDAFFVVKSDGKVGIGTNNPVQKLDVKGGIGFDFNSSDKKLYSPEDGILEWMTHDLAAGKGFAVSHQGQKRVYLATNGNSYLNGGNVGIGVLNPVEKLQVNGDIFAASRLSFQDNARFSVTNTDVPSLSTTGYSMPHYGLAAPSTGGAADLWVSGYQAVRFFTNGNAKPSLNLVNGNLGIGTINPLQKLDVVGNLRISGSIMRPDNAGLAMQLGNGTNAIYGNTAFYDIVGTNQRMLISETGNVGIGTSLPTANLHLKATGNSTLKVESSNVSIIHLASTFGNAMINNYNDGSLRINNAYDASLSHIVVNSAGNVGIGTATIPVGYKMAVAGNIIVDKIKVRKSTNGTWPDFVFKKDYQLPSLSEIESFVNENSHLPEIPSAAEIEKEGQDLGEMNRLLLKKVEELTLYLIEMEKNTKAQTQNIKDLIKSNAELTIWKNKIETQNKTGKE